MADFHGFPEVEDIATQMVASGAMVGEGESDEDSGGGHLGYPHCHSYTKPAKHIVTL